MLCNLVENGPACTKIRGTQSCPQEHGKCVSVERDLLAAGALNIRQIDAIEQRREKQRQEQRAAYANPSQGEYY